jgi:hypothetical protein
LQIAAKFFVKTYGAGKLESWIVKRSMDAASDCSTVMHCGVASIAQSDQVLLRIMAGLAAKLVVMDFKVGDRPARLASPVVPP